MRLLDKIKSRGYWEVVIRPCRFKGSQTMKLTDMDRFVMNSQVRIRGWPFPAEAEGQTKILGDCVSGEVEWSYHREAWRLYQSGQFVWFKANRWDWMEDQLLDSGPARFAPGTVLSVGDAVYIACEVFEFASRLALSSLGDEKMQVEIAGHGLSGRHLWIDIWNDTPGRKCNAASWSIARDYQRGQLAAESRGLALAAAGDLFQLFGWDASPDVLAGILDRYARM